jgi:hypothetical protein
MIGYNISGLAADGKTEGQEKQLIFFTLISFQCQKAGADLEQLYFLPVLRNLRWFGCKQKR